MHIDFHAFFQENFITIALILGVAIATFSSRKSPIPAIGTIWIIIALLAARTFLGFVNQYASDFYPEATDIRYATTVAEYLINPFILLMEILMLTRDRIVKLLLWIPAVINTLMLLVMPRFGYVPAYYAYNYQFRVGPLRYANLYIVIFYLLCFVVFSIMYFKNYKKADRNMIWFVFILSALAIFLETENIITGYINAVIAVDLLFYYMFLNMAYQTQLEERVLKQELELTQTNVRLMQEQISPHFIFNALYIIKALVWVDKKKASEAI
ncbi:MAG: histidine kinase [Firmicutes bacterium]|nr:histidine kinase [Bacillota bacterium]